MSTIKLSRRDFFQRAAVLGASATVGGILLSACRGGGGGSSSYTCTDTSGLEPGDIQMRTTTNYMDKTATPNQWCHNCTHWQPAGENECGGCAVLKGPIHAEGWCTLWVATA